MNKQFNVLLKETKKSLKKYQPSLIATVAGLVFGLLIMLIFNILEALPGFFTLLVGSLNEGLLSLGTAFYIATPIILTGLSVGFAFKTGLFNIGAPGQMVVGAYTAIHIGVLWSIPAPFHWIVALLLGTLVGAFWGLIPGLLKALANVNEVVSTIMMNYIGMYLVMYLVGAYVKNPDKSLSMNVKSSAVLPTLGLDKIFVNSQINIGIFIALFATIIIYIILNKTTLGYQLKATGFNKNASIYAGINVKRNIIISMSIAGALSGLAGAITYLVTGKYLSTQFGLLPGGFDGISVALLGLNEPFGAFIAGLFLSHLRQGGYYMQLYNFRPEIIDIIISTIIYFSALATTLQVLFIRVRHRTKNKLFNRQEINEKSGVE